MQNKAQQLGSSLQQPRVVITADQRSFKIIFTAGMYPICFKAGMYLIFKPDGSAHDRSIFTKELIMNITTREVKTC